MNIQNNSNINFQATRILTAKQNLIKGGTEVLDVYRINYHDDYGFIKKCNDIFESTKTKRLKPFEKACKNFFSYLGNKVNGETEDFYIAVKDDKTIEGFLISLPFFMDVIPLKLFTRNNSPQQIKTLFYAFLKDTQEEYNGFNIKLDSLTHKKGRKIKAEDINKFCDDLKKEIPDYNLKLKKQENINLDSVFDTYDFETEIYPNLK